MKTEHTQGEWTVKHSNRGAIVIHDPNGSCIADCNMTADIKTEKKEANARLIAAAPDLLGALKMIIADIENGHIDAENGIVKGSYHFHIMQNAIQKATEQ